MHHHQHIAELGPVLEELGARHVIIAPGSRNAPLIQLFTSQLSFICHSIVDERSAGYVALGMAKQLGEPVVLLTTSGTAVLNLSPAIAEAYQQQIPLLVLTADRPREIIPQFNNQVCDQRAPYFNFSKGFLGFPAEIREEEDLEREIRAAALLFREGMAYPPGPVHVNVPLTEPLYEPLPASILSREEKAGDMQTGPVQGDALSAPDAGGKKVMILAGMGKRDPELQKLLELSGTLVVAENISNLDPEHFISVPELVLAGASEEEVPALVPDLVISFGQQVVSKRLRLFLQAVDKLEVRELRGPEELSVLIKDLASAAKADLSYRRLWKEIENRECRRAEGYLRRAGFANLSAVARILEAVPANTAIHLGNSASIRYSQLVRARSDLCYYSNRGISGIDGSLSSAVGAAMVSDQQHLLILGDLSFIYDSNALWNKDFPENLKIVVLNDGGGGIFRLLDGPGRMDFYEEFSITHHPVSLELLAAAYGRSVARAGNMDELDDHLKSLCTPGHALSVLEVDTTGCENSRIFKDLFKQRDS